MNPHVNLTKQVMAAAAISGSASPPTTLLSLLSNQADPFAFASNGDGWSDVWTALQADFPSIWDRVLHNSGLTSDETEHLAGLVRWIDAGRQTWTSSEATLINFCAWLVSAKYCAPAGGLWEALDAREASAPAVLDGLQALIAGIGIQNSSTGGLPLPIYEAELVAAMEIAERDKDWAMLGEHAPRFADVLRPSEVLVQGLSALVNLSPKRLESATSGIKQFFAAVMVVRSLDDLDPLLSSQNPFLQFAIVLRVGPGGRPGVSGPYFTASRLVDLLADVAKDGPRWKGWMKALNRYPARFPDLQPWLGQALARAPEAALKAYVNAFELYAAANPPGRAIASEALSAFRAVATPQQRMRLWRLAFQRWKVCDFAAPERDDVLTEVARTALDYATVGYWLECRDAAERAADLQAVVDELVQLETKWFSGIVAYHSAWRRGLSRIQPIQHAQHVLSEQLSWLQGAERTYLTFDTNTDPYAVAKLGWR